MAADLTLEEHFAALAKQFRAKASNEKGSPKAQWEHLADCYTQLINTSDRNRLNETVPNRSGEA
jgi:hypothetical protein